jgi:hypothetical protein
MDYDASRSLASVRCVAVHCRYGCSVCDVQFSGIGAAARVGSYMEQCLVSAFGLRCDQLYEELGLCLLCGCGVVDRGLCFDDGVAQGEGEGWSGGCVDRKAMIVNGIDQLDQHGRIDAEVVCDGDIQHL